MEILLLGLASIIPAQNQQKYLLLAASKKRFIIFRIGTEHRSGVAPRKVEFFLNLVLF